MEQVAGDLDYRVSEMKPLYIGPLNTGNAQSSAASIRLARGNPVHQPVDLADLDLEPTICFTRKSDLELAVTVAPQEGPYQGGSFPFSCTVTLMYPYSPPKLKCLAKVRALINGVFIDFPSKHRLRGQCLLEHT